MLSIGVLFATLAVIGMTNSQVASAEEAGSKCTCQYQNGEFGVIRNNDCIVENCWLPIE
jgi:hypothetical protein